MASADSSSPGAVRARDHGLPHCGIRSIRKGLFPGPGRTVSKFNALTRSLGIVMRLNRYASDSVHRISQRIVRRMGAWVDDRFEEAEEAVRTRFSRRTGRVLRDVCDGGGARFPVTSSLLPLRRQFSRQLYEWPVLPLFKSRTKLVGETVARPRTLVL
ncbi:uncharacterized protein LOC105701686 [Orussus abietinus]|uniref:uncharacterized protein LOC105701686 n=1 Tax=Orussus abietinus TaxID=222816 RepID=UPI0006267C5D|nr:uncharacterized protein LOC105701686 [Orussus abietinus]